MRRRVCNVNRTLRVHAFKSIVCAVAIDLPGLAAAQVPIITELCDLPSEVLETSGLENGPNDWFWTHNDSGNPATLFCVDTTGTVQRTVSVQGDPNVDWEEIAKDDDGNLYIGNFGNNSLNRADLRIVKIPNIDTCTTTALVTDTIAFTYPDQSAFPPAGGYGNFDMEAMFHYQNELHLFSKDRSTPSTGYTKHYTLPDAGGTYVANLVDSFDAGHVSYVFAITAADISETGDQMALLTSDRIWLFSNYVGTDFFGGDVAELTLSVFSQKEGICFKNGFMYVTDEESFGLGGKMYRIHPDVFVAIDDAVASSKVVAVYDASLRLERFSVSIANSDEPCLWKVLSPDGRLMAEGPVSNHAVERSELPVTQGLYVLQIWQNEKAVGAQLIRL